MGEDEVGGLGTGRVDVVGGEEVAIVQKGQSGSVEGGVVGGIGAREAGSRWSLEG